jgi:hypothetical protein
VFDVMMSVALWGGAGDSARLARAAEAVRDTVEQLDSLLVADPRGRSIGREWRVQLDSVRSIVRGRTGIDVPLDLLARSYALDRGALALQGVADSALLDLGGQFLWAAESSTARIVGIPDPANSLSTVARVELRAGSVSTAADTGRTHTVTVLAPSALTAAAWSAALLKTSCDNALAVGARADLGVHLGVVCRDSSGVRWTANLERRVVVPTALGRAAAGGRAGREP